MFTSHENLYRNCEGANTRRCRGTWLRRSLREEIYALKDCLRGRRGFESKYKTFYEYDCSLCVGLWQL